MKTIKIPAIKLEKEAVAALAHTMISDDRLVEIMNQSNGRQGATTTQQRWMAAQLLGQRYKLTT